jgi:hypothetical protein
LTIPSSFVDFQCFQSELDQEALKAHYNSYLAAGLISVYNPVSIVSAFTRSKIENFWVATGLPSRSFLFFDQLSDAMGEYPLLRRNIPDGISALETIKTLLTGGEIERELETNVTFSAYAHRYHFVRY